MSFDALLHSVNETNGGGNLIVQGSTTPVIISGLTVSFDGGDTFVPYTYLGQGTFRGTDEAADFIEVDGEIYAFSPVDPTGPLSTGNWQITVGDLDPTDPPCFVAGSWIDTVEGPRRVEDLSVGDHLCVADGRALPIVWIGKRTLSAEKLQQRPEFRPVCIKRDALGVGIPDRDLYVSPQHRIVLQGWWAELFFGEPKVFCAAIHLVNDHTIRRVEADAPVVYFHIACSEHVILRSQGLDSESLFLGDQALKSFHREDVEELRALFPELRMEGHIEQTRLRCLKRPEAALLADVISRQ